MPRESITMEVTEVVDETPAAKEKTVNEVALFLLPKATLKIVERS